MAQDLRDMFKEHRKTREDVPFLKKGHSTRFLVKLDERLPEKKGMGFYRMAVAASVAIILGLGVFYLNRDTIPPVPDSSLSTAGEGTTSGDGIALSLGDLSPDLKKVEDYYVANINLVLANLEVSSDNKGMIDGFMEQLAVLDKEYEKLNIELNTLGPNEQTIAALIKNLQLRLQLLQKLKTKLNELKTSENEQLETHFI